MYLQIPPAGYSVKPPFAYFSGKFTCMKIITAALLLLGCSAQAQIQFWNIADVEDAPLMQARKTAGITQMLAYRTGQDMLVKDSAGADEAYTYNGNGQQLTHTRYKYDWVLKQRFIQRADSCFYNTAGKLTAFRSYEGYNIAGARPVYELKTVYNSKGQCVKMLHYNLYSGLDGPETVDVFEWNGGNRPLRHIILREGKTRDGVRRFTYDKAGRLTGETITYAGAGGVSATTFLHDAQGRLLKYEEKTGGEITKTQTCEYDALGRLIKKTSQTPAGYSDFTEYRYHENSMLPQSSYLQYGISSNKNDRRHEYTVYVYKTL
jgi:YD repeat-containing protein